MFKTVFIQVFFLFAFSPIIAAIEVRDTSPILQCDTIIVKDGMVSPVKIISVGNVFITYKQCSNSAIKTYTIETNKVQDIKSKTFSLPKPIPLLTKAKKALKLALISTVVFFVSLILVIPSFEGDSGEGSKLIIIPFIALLVSPFIIVGSFFNSIAVVAKAQKAKDKKAATKATGGLILSLLAILVILALIL